MKKLILCALLLGLTPLVASACAGATCFPDDVACFMDHMAIAEPVNNGKTLELSRIQSNLLPASSEMGPSILGPILPIAYAKASELQPLSLPWADPEGCDPAMCFQLCSEIQGCAADFMCAPPFEGASPWRAYMGFLAEPTSYQNARLRVVIVPVTAEGCAPDVIERLESGDPTIRVGVARSTEIILGHSDHDAEGSCSASQTVCGCELRACSDGSCWYETGAGGHIECQEGCDCASRESLILTTCCTSP